MWFFMNGCYVLTAISLIMLVLSGAQGYFSFFVLNANHATFALLTVIIYLFTETLVIFYFVGIGVSIKEFTLERKLNTSYQRRSIEIKRRMYPPLLLNMLMVMVLFISGGAVDTHRIPHWAHGLLFYFCIAHFLYTMKIQHESFKESTAIVLEMSGINSA